MISLNIFAGVYRLFADLFGPTLASYLEGTAAAGQPGDMFVPIGLTMLAVTAVAVVLFYFVINYPSFNNLVSWLTALAVNAAVNLLIGWQWTAGHYEEGKMVSTDPATGLSTPLPVTGDDLLGFGIANAILSAIFFLIFSYCVKWWSTNCSRAPF